MEKSSQISILGIRDATSRFFEMIEGFGPTRNQSPELTQSKPNQQHYPTWDITDSLSASKKIC